MGDRRRAGVLGLSLVAMAATSGCNQIFGIEEGIPRDPATGGTGGTGGTAPGGLALYASVPELKAARAAAEDGRQPWAAAYTRFQNDLPLARALTPISVIDNGGGFDETNDNRFATDSATTPCDPANLMDGRHDYCGALVMGRAVRDLAICFVMDGEAADADRAVDHAGPSVLSSRQL